jgi:membrane dipeptidase
LALVSTGVNASGGILLPANQTVASCISSRAHNLHFRSIVVDTHVDTTQRLVFDQLDLGARHPVGSVDIPRMREGGVGALFLAIWTPGRVTGPAAVQRALEQFEAIRRQVALHPNDLAMATSANDIRQAHLAGQIALLTGVEGGHLIDNDLDTLRNYRGLGAAYMTLTHAVNVDWADASTDKPVHNGLTGFGEQVIHEMNRLGMMVDVSHVSDKTFYDVLTSSQAPVIATHSSCRTLCDSVRDMSDEMIQALAEKDGVIQINFHVGFLSQQFRDALKANPRLQGEIEAQAKKRCGENHACQLLERTKLTRELVEQGALPRVEWTDIIDHVDHAVKLVGAEHVGLGSDFDGADMPYGMEDASHLPQITDALLKKGYSEGDIQKILGGNTLRLMQDVEATASKIGGAT